MAVALRTKGYGDDGGWRWLLGFARDCWMGRFSGFNCLWWQAWVCYCGSFLVSDDHGLELCFAWNCGSGFELVLKRCCAFESMLNWWLWVDCLDGARWWCWLVSNLLVHGWLQYQLLGIRFELVVLGLVLLMLLSFGCWGWIWIDDAAGWFRWC